MANEPTLLPQLKGDKPAGARHGPTAGPAGRRPALPAIGKADRPPGEEAAAPEEAGAGGGGEAGKSDAGSARSAQQQPASREAGSRNPPGRFSAAAAAAAAPSSGARRQAALASLYANAHTYNRALVPPHKWRVLSLAERAKYLAYAPPDPQIKGRAEEAARRATAATRVCRERWLAQHPDFCWPSAAAAPVQEPPSGAEANPWTGQAKRRLRSKEKRRLLVKERELQILVDGQKTAMDAICLMEFCGPAVVRCSPAVPVPQLREEEKRRLTSILENGIEC